MGPPKDIPASQLWLKLSQAERPHKIVDFPRKGLDGEPVGQLAIRILTQEEQMICTAAAEDLARKHIKEGKKDELGYERIFTDAVMVEVLYRACRDASDTAQPAFPTPQEVRRTLTTEECAKLFEYYVTVQLELGPTIITTSDEELDAWTSRLAEGGLYFFDQLSSDLQKLLAFHMACQLHSLRTDSSSAGTPPEETISSDSEKPEMPVSE